MSAAAALSLPLQRGPAAAAPGAKLLLKKRSKVRETDCGDSDSQVRALEARVTIRRSTRMPGFIHRLFGRDHAQDCETLSGGEIYN